MTDIDVDYLVVGAGAMGMAFTDVILDETDATVAIVERRSRPGGHWTDAYPFVRLHQPSAFYGVNSRPLGSDTIDATGWNAGLYELASAAEVCTYFDHLMNQAFLPSGRVQFLPNTTYDGDRRITSALTGDTTPVSARATIVDATYMNVSVPATHRPSYEVDERVRCVPINGLASIGPAGPGERPERFVIIGAGKTGMDACLFLLANGVDPDLISWITPRDSWVLDRANIQPGPEFAARAVGSFAATMEVSAQAANVEELFLGLEAAGVLARIDRSVTPTMYRCATVTQAEIEQLRRIEDVVRLGRVKRIAPDAIELDGGSIPTGADVLHVGCTSDGLARRPVVPVFDEEQITLQTVRTCQQVFSAAFIAHVEATYTDHDQKTRLSTVVPHPDSDTDWLRVTLANTLNAIQWRMDPDLNRWLTDARLDGFSGTRRYPDASEIEQGEAAASKPSSDGAELLAATKKLLEHTEGAVGNLQRLIDGLPG